MPPATDLTHLVGPALAQALATKGYDTLTAVQEAVLDEALEGRDLRITSQTGSGKTIAIGFAVRDLLDDLTAQFGGPARPRVLILAPTRELAKQVSDELSWLYAPLRVRVAAVTGGAGYVDQKRALSANPAVIVATPGRLRDALERGRIDAATLAAVVLDEADSMLDLGFREDLDAILGMLPAERRSHLVSATFSRDVVALADKFQKDPVHVQGTALGEAHSDVEHVVHLVDPRQRVDALVNLLLSDEEAKSLVFARTRADVARIAGELSEAGFVVRTLSGEMEQPERDRALAAFRQGGVQALVATDVAARGIDVRDVARVIQIEPPTDVETYTHRSGRTGRAGKQGTSVLFVAPAHYPNIARGLGRAKIKHTIEPIPRPDAIQRAREEKLVAWLARDGDGETIDPHAIAIAEQILKGPSPVNSIARLIDKAGLHGPTRAREVRNIPPPMMEERPSRARVERPAARPGRYEPRSQARHEPTRHEARHDARGSTIERRPPGPPADVPPAARDRGPSHGAPPPRAPVPAPRRGEREGPHRGPHPGPEAWVTFRVTWGGTQGADPRRLLAVVCRRGNIRGSDVGAIRVDERESYVDVSRDVAEAFEVDAAKPDPRDARVRIARAGASPARREQPARRDHPARRDPEARREQPARRDPPREQPAQPERRDDRPPIARREVRDAPQRPAARGGHHGLRRHPKPKG
ncbi:MAG TPA: DEAD/DEAH box helicase [Polyangiaceae bacterium]|jgi:ATP-dependent RNA helicase DeaD